MPAEYAQFAMRNPAYVTKNVRAQYKVRKAMLAYRKANPVCEATGLKKGLQVHHIYPVATHPHLAADPENLITLEKLAHRVLGHCGNYKNSVPNIREVIATMKRTMIVVKTVAHSD